jgi:hypothetical protein
MADNLTTTTTVSTVPSGTVISTDDAGASGHVQRMKIAYSADGVATHAQVDADGILVNLGTNNDVTLATLPDTAAGDLAAIVAALGGTLTVDLGANNDVTMATLPDTAAGDLAAIVAALGGTLTVDGSGVTQPVSGTVTANLSATDNTVLDNIDTNTDYGQVTGGGVEASALRVTLANDSTGVLSVDDNGATLSIDDGGGSLTVDGTVTANLSATDNAVLDAIAASAAAIDSGQLADGHNVTVDNAAGASAVNIQDGGNSITVDGTVTANLSATDNAVLDAIAAAQLPDGHNVTVDNASIAITHAALTELAAAINTSELDVNIATDSVGIGGGTQYTEDDAAAANPVGTVPVMVRDDAPSAITSTDGDVIAQRATNYGAGYVQVVDSSGNFVDTFGGSGGTAAADDADFVAGTTQGTMIQGVYESSPTSVTDGDMGAVGITQTRSMKVQETNSAAILADTANMDTNLGTVAGAVSGSEMQVDVVASLPAGDNNIGNVDIASSVALDVSAATVTVDLGANNDVVVSGTDAENAAATANPALVGGRYDATPRTLGDGDAGAIALDADGAVQISDGGNAITVDGTVTETNSAAILADTANMDTNLGTIAGAVSGSEMQVDVVSSALPTGAATAANQLPDGHNVTIDNASGASAVNIQDGGNSITVDGTVTANLSATDNAVLDTIETNTDYGTVTGGGVEASALRVTIANDSTGVVSVDDNGGSLTVDVGTALPAGDNNIGNVDIASSVALDVSAATVTVDLGANNDVVAAGDVAHDAADSGNPVKVGGVAYNMDGSVPGTAVAEGDRAEFATDVYGRQLVTDVHPNYWHVSADYAAAQTNATVKAAPGAGLKLYVTDIMISNGATAGNITLLDGSGGTVLIEIYPAVNGGASMNLRTPIALTANTLLAITSTTVTTHSVFVSGYTAP